LKALPIKIAERCSGLASTRSYEPVMISNSRFEPVALVPNKQIITITPGKNHCSGDAPFRTAGSTDPASSGPNKPRKTSG
jgi:hypothetical protein